MAGDEGKKRKYGSARMSHGSHRGGGNKKGDMGRKNFARANKDFSRRDRNEEEQHKRRKLEEQGRETVLDKPSVLPAPFSKEEIEAEEKRPKRKVAVMIGYSGTGYKGMQINTVEKTIEGDLFTAFVKAGAISKANASDPKKTSLVRCARTDKGVHAAGNVISLKLIVEDDDIVQRINDNLSEQIRVWGIQRTVGSFSCYQACDSRWYEYLIPSHAFLPPHPSSWLARRLKEIAAECDDLEGYESRQAEMAGWWEEVEETQIKPVIATIDASIREKVLQALYDDTEEYIDADDELATPARNADDSAKEQAENTAQGEAEKETEAADSTEAPAGQGTDRRARLQEKRNIDAAVKLLRTAYLTAKRHYRISEARFARIQPVLDQFLGTKNFHNYTVDKSFKDSSAQRYIKSFKVDSDRKIVGDTEWLSIKIHGQSFMMHQIRKMIGCIALTVRCGAAPAHIANTVIAHKISIPKVPGLGLLLERPVFESYNANVAPKFDRETIDFGRYEEEMEAFKQREIYQRVYREEEEGKHFHSFFSHTDNLRDPQFLWLSSGGVDAVRKAREARKAAVESVKGEEEKEKEEAASAGQRDGEKRIVADVDGQPQAAKQDGPLAVEESGSAATEGLQATTSTDVPKV